MPAASSLMKPEPTAAERFLFSKSSYVDVQSCILRGLTAKGGAGVAAAVPSMLAESSRPTKLRRPFESRRFLRRIGTCSPANQDIIRSLWRT